MRAMWSHQPAGRPVTGTVILPARPRPAPEVLPDLPAAQHLDGARAGTPENALQNSRRQIAMPAQELFPRLSAVLEVTPRKRSLPGPGARQARKIRRKPLQRVL